MDSSLTLMTIRKGSNQKVIASESQRMSGLSSYLPCARPNLHIIPFTLHDNPVSLVQSFLPFCRCKGWRSKKFCGCLIGLHWTHRSTLSPGVLAAWVCAYSSLLDSIGVSGFRLVVLLRGSSLIDHLFFWSSPLALGSGVRRIHHCLSTGSSPRKLELSGLPMGVCFIYLLDFSSYKTPLYLGF